MSLTFKQYLVEYNQHSQVRDYFADMWYDKPTTWHEVMGRVHTADKKDIEQSGIDLAKMPYYEAKELWMHDIEHHLPSPHDDFEHKPREVLFVLKVPGEGEYLVNTEGYDYARYVIKLDI